MSNFLIKFLKYHNYLLFFILFIVAYFSIGGYLIQANPVTGDELAHLSGAHGISQGQPINIEHPPLLKTLNAAVIKVFFNNYVSSDSGQWSRSVDFLIDSEYNPKTILEVSRWVYLIFDCLLLIWLLFYTCVFRLLSPKFSLILGLLYTFSPSFFSHNYLLLFDVSGSITALITTLTFGILIKNWTKFSSKQLITHSLIGIFLLTFALNLKFSNFVFVIIFLLFTLGFLAYSYKHKLWFLFKQILTLLTSTIIIFTSFTWLIYTFSYASTPSPYPSISSITGNTWVPFFRYGLGAGMTAVRSQSIYENFVNNDYQALTFPQFAWRVFWFKENPVIILLIVLSFFSLALIFFKSLVYYLKFKPKILNLTSKYKLEISLILMYSSFPLIYFLSIRNTTFTIGYRHFYPMLIFIYAGISYLIYLFIKNISFEKRNFLNLFKNFGIILILALYSTFGVLAIPQGITYTNFLWTKEKWRLAADSTVTWGEGEGLVLDFLIKENRLNTAKKTELGEFWNVVFDSNSGPNFQIHIIKVLGKNNKIDRTDNLFKNSLENEYKSLKKDYLVVDISTFQRLTSQYNTNEIAKGNLDFLNSQKPIFSYNNVIFVYELKN